MLKKLGAFSNRLIRHIFGTGFLGSKKRVFLSYCLALLLPCIVIVLFVQSNYIHRIQANYEDGITQHVQMISNDIDNMYANIESIVHTLCVDKTTEWNSAPWKPKEYFSLVEKLKYYASEIKGLDEIVVFDESNSYLMSSLSSSSFDSFVKLHEITRFNDGNAFRDHLLNCSLWDAFHATYNGNRYICFVYPVRDPSKSSRALLFLIKDSSLISMLSNALIDGEGFVAMYDREGCLLLSAGTADSNALISHVYSRSYPFSYETRIDTGTFVHEIQMLKQNWIIVLLLTILTGICFAVTLTYASFKPLEKLSHHLTAGSSTEDFPDTNYEDVIQAVDTMRIQMTTLRSYYRSTQTHFIEKLIYGDTEDGTVLRVLQNTFNLPPVVYEWQVAVIETNTQTDFYELQSRLASSLPRGIVPLLCERKQSNRSVLVLAYCNSISDVIQIESNLREIRAVDRITLSQKIKKVEDIPYAFVEASVLFLDHFSNPVTGLQTMNRFCHCTMLFSAAQMTKSMHH